MAGLKISELPSISSITTNDIIPITDIDTLVTSKITFSNFLGSFITQNNWTPVITFATPGNLAVSYSVQSGFYYKSKNLVVLQFQILTSSFIHTTASGIMRVTGLPFPFSFSSTIHGSLVFGGITKANYTQYAPTGIQGNSYFEIYASGSGQSLSSVASGDTPSGGTMALYGTITYLTV